MEENLLWLVFKLKDNSYAINVNYISSIAILEDNLTPIPSSQPFIKGVTKIHNKLITVMDMREFLNIPNLDTEYNNFKQMLDARKTDHITWVETLCKSVENEVPFNLATDPHKCALGKWRDNFQTNIQEINFQLNKMDKPHFALHNIANEIKKAKAKNNDQSYDFIQNKLNIAKTELMPNILKCLEETKEVFISAYRGILLCLNSTEQKTLGLIVDEVLGVEYLNDICNEEMLASVDSQFIYGIFNSPKIDGLILKLNIPKLIKHVSDKI